MHLRLKVVRGKPRGHCLSFPSGEYMFGRGPECDVRANSDLVSRQHCLLHVTEDAASIRDLGSTNGTLVNGQLVRAVRPLANGDTLEIGPLVLETILNDQPETIAELATDTLEAVLESSAPDPVVEQDSPTSAHQAANI
jgi:pSer/pThr/pTyr-binding forkhead associated (FHA) protein